MTPDARALTQLRPLRNAYGIHMEFISPMARRHRPASAVAAITHPNEGTMK